MRTEGVSKFTLGATLKGKDDDGNLLNEGILGTIKQFPAYPDGGESSITGNRSNRTAYPVTAIALRNTSGGALSPKTVVRLDISSEAFGVSAKAGFFHNAVGASSALGQMCVVVDEFITGTVADDEIFWGIIRGPVTALLDSAFAGTSAVGDALVAGANGGLDAQTTEADTLVMALALETKDASEECLVNMIAPYIG